MIQLIFYVIAIIAKIIACVIFAFCTFKGVKSTGEEMNYYFFLAILAAVWATSF